LQPACRATCFGNNPGQALNMARELATRMNSDQYNIFGAITCICM
jgi:hypothetical protein